MPSHVDGPGTLYLIRRVVLYDAYVAEQWGAVGLLVIRLEYVGAG